MHGFVSASKPETFSENSASSPTPGISCCEPWGGGTGANTARPRHSSEDSMSELQNFRLPEWVAPNPQQPLKWWQKLLRKLTQELLKRQA